MVNGPDPEAALMTPGTVKVLVVCAAKPPPLSARNTGRLAPPDAALVKPKLPMTPMSVPPFKLIVPMAPLVVPCVVGLPNWLALLMAVTPPLRSNAAEVVLATSTES